MWRKANDFLQVQLNHLIDQIINKQTKMVSSSKLAWNNVISAKNNRREKKEHYKGISSINCRLFVAIGYFLTSVHMHRNVSIATPKCFKWSQCVFWIKRCLNAECHATSDAIKYRSQRMIPKWMIKIQSKCACSYLFCVLMFD